MKRDIMNDKKMRGMTLVELLIVVAIVAILASVALPSWNSQVQKARRADARNALLNVQLEQEKYRSTNGSYAGSLSDLGLGQYTSGDYYNVSIASNSATAFLATAAPNTNGGQNSDSCGTFAITQSGASEDGDYATIASCW
jgi:type IV pilus assembly protein PilE